MSEEDNFKSAKEIALNAALKNLDTEVKNFFHDRFKNLNYNDIAKIAEKFLTKNEPRFISENLPDGDMICYAEIEAQINLDDLNNFLKNFDVFKLERKVDKMQKIIDELNNKFELYQEFLPKVIEAEINVNKKPDYSWEYRNRGMAYKNLQNYEQAINDFSKYIEFVKNDIEVYVCSSECYKENGEIEKAEADFAKARKLANK